MASEQYPPVMLPQLSLSHVYRVLKPVTVWGPGYAFTHFWTLERDDHFLVLRELATIGGTALYSDDRRYAILDAQGRVGNMLLGGLTDYTEYLERV